MTAPVTLDHRASGYSLRLAYCLAQACALAYKDEATIQQQAEKWGFGRVRHHETRFTPPSRSRTHRPTRWPATT
ncbi:hypothetical protein [Streptomyces coeruleorubidus]